MINDGHLILCSNWTVQKDCGGGKTRHLRSPLPNTCHLLSYHRGYCAEKQPVRPHRACLYPLSFQKCHTKLGCYRFQTDNMLTAYKCVRDLYVMWKAEEAPVASVQRPQCLTTWEEKQDRLSGNVWMEQESESIKILEVVPNLYLVLKHVPC